jgi:GT2 family glycosyltransferase
MLMRLDKKFGGGNGRTKPSRASAPFSKLAAALGEDAVPVGLSPGSELLELRKAVAHQREMLLLLSGDLNSLTDTMVHAVRQVSPKASDVAAYQVLIYRIHLAAATVIAKGSAVAIASKGDEQIVRLQQRKGWHFPQAVTGEYLGYYPGSSLSAIAQLEAIRAKGATHFLLPQFSFWWLEHYAEFRQHLEMRYEKVFFDESSCAIYRLSESRAATRGQWTEELANLISAVEARLGGRRASILDLGTGLDLVARFSEQPVLTCKGSQSSQLPYMDRSVDVVVLPAQKSKDSSLQHEARRLAREVVAEVSRCGADQWTLRATWQNDAADLSWPSVSIIIPCYNGIAYTRACLQSLAETLPTDFRGEVIVVDDASTDGTSEELKKTTLLNGRLRVVRNARNLGFVASSNRGAAAAKGDVLLFLNNDMLLLDGWLPPLLRTLRDSPDAGAVGGKLVFPDGTLQEAGCAVFADASAVKVGYCDLATDEAPYSHVRRVDYCSGCLLATPRRLFESLGGFDLRFAPGYYEDVDYCFRLRRAGKQVYYQPRSAAIHFEGATAGNDLNAGMKRHQIANQKKFRRLWASALKDQPARPAALDKDAWYLLARADTWKGAQA